MTYFTTYARRYRIRTNNLNVLDIALVKHKEEKREMIVAEEERVSEEKEGLQDID